MTLNTVTISEEICAYILNIFVSICKFPINKFRNYLYPHVMVTLNCLPGITREKSLWECLNYINRRKICPLWAALFPGSGVLGCLSVERGLCTTVHCPSTLLHVVTKVVKWPVLSSSCCVTSLQWWPLTYDCDLNKLSRCFFLYYHSDRNRNYNTSKNQIGLFWKRPIPLLFWVTVFPWGRLATPMRT